MIKIVIVLPYAAMAELAQQVFLEQTEDMRTRLHDVGEYSLETLVASTTAEVLAAAPDCDVMIARGGTYSDLCKCGYPVPLVELIISGTDIVNMLLLLREEHGDTPAAILGTPNMILGIEKLGAKLGVDVTPYFLEQNTRQEIHLNVEQAIRDGKKVIIGGMTGCRRAAELGCPSQLIASGRDAFWNAITEAEHLAKVSLEEREKAMGFQTLLDNAYEGLVSVDKNNCVSFINAAAVRILQLSAQSQILGKNVTEVFFSPALNRLLFSGDEYMDEIIEYKNTHLSVKKINLIMHGKSVGSVVTILNAAQIQTTEDKLRGKIYRKGHTAKYTFDQLLTQNPRMLERIQEAKAYARTDSNIMIVGESGTGKELFSQSIHNWSKRAAGNFVAVNCAALPENLLESELFGYVEGAFTGATKSGKPGLFEIAHNGTIFLDEISEIPLYLQGRLLRVLQEREIMRLGDSKVIPINIRVIAATNKRLEDLVYEGKFRRDLYYRLYVLQMSLPPLRERKDDLPILAERFLRDFCAQSGGPVPELTKEDYLLLQQKPWYGNIRELRNFCERLAVLYQPGLSVSQMIANLFEMSAPSIPYDRPDVMPAEPAQRLTRESDTDYEAVLRAISACRGNKTKAAEMLGVSRVTLWRLLKKHGEPETQA